jgi:hypothetical protein
VRDKILLSASLGGFPSPPPPHHPVSSPSLSTTNVVSSPSPMHPRTMNHDAPPRSTRKSPLSPPFLTTDRSHRSQSSYSRAQHGVSQTDSTRYVLSGSTCQWPTLFKFVSLPLILSSPPFLSSCLNRRLSMHFSNVFPALWFI